MLQDAADLQRMLKCMASNGFLSKEMGVKIVPMEPYEYLQLAELNQRSVGFIPAGTQVCLHSQAMSGELQIIPAPGYVSERATLHARVYSEAKWQA